MQSREGPYSVRLRMLRQLAGVKDELKIGIPEFCVIPHPEIVGMVTGQSNAERVVENLMAATASLPSDRIFARAQPLDESLFPERSFAGVYKSYISRRGTSRTKNLADGLETVLSGRYNRQADYYYSRHGMESSRPVDVMFSSMVENTVGFGTAYVHADKCLLTYFDSPVSIVLGDPLRMAARRGRPGAGIASLFCEVMFRVSELWDIPIDVEFLVDRFFQVFISQVRPMPGIHSRNWRMVREECWDEICDYCVPSNVVNTVGTIEGIVADLRQRMISIRDADVSDGRNRIYVISHHSNSSGTSSLDMLEFINRYKLTGVALIVDHARSRCDDHLQYLMHEDPGIEFLAHTADEIQPCDGSDRIVVSDGFYVRMK